MHRIDFKSSAAACKAEEMGSIPFPASHSSRYSGETIIAPRAEP